MKRLVSAVGMIVTLIGCAEEEPAKNAVLAYYYVDNEDTYFTLEDSYEFSLTIVTEEVVDDFDDNLVDFVNIFARTTDPTLDLSEGRGVSSYLANSDKNYTFTKIKYIFFEHSRNGFIPYPETHFTDVFSVETLLYSSLPLSKLPH